MKKVLTIAGSDCSGGAGIEADLKTITAHKTYGMSVITALTAQNTTGVYGILETPPEFIGKQMDAVFSDIIPDAVKIGMVTNKAIIQLISGKLQQYNAKNIVLDPVMVSTSGRQLLSDDAIDVLTRQLAPLAAIITPNIPEAERLCGFNIRTKKNMEKAARQISAYCQGDVLIKGGHLTGGSDDLLYASGQFYWFNGNRIQNPNTHGTGCTLSSSIACNLAQGLPIEDCVKNAKHYITGAIRTNLDLGRGNGPLNHGWDL